MEKIGRPKTTRFGDASARAAQATFGRSPQGPCLASVLVTASLFAVLFVPTLRPCAEPAGVWSAF